MKSEFIQNGELRIHLLRNEVAGSPSILYVPGMFGVAEHCLPELNALPLVPAVALSIRGRGKSTRHTKYFGIDDQASDIVAVIDSMPKKTEFLICGHSYGNLLTVVAAHERQSRIKGLILIDRGLSNTKNKGDWLGYVRDNPPETSSVETAEAIAHMSDERDLWGVFKRLEIPTLVVKGEKESSLLNEEEMTKFVELDFVEGLRLKNSGHFPEGEDYQLFITKLTSFRSNLTS